MEKASKKTFILKHARVMSFIYCLSMQNKIKNKGPGNHICFLRNVKFVKETSIGDYFIFAAGAIKTSKEYPKNIIIGGIEKILKENVDWCAERIPV